MKGYLDESNIKAKESLGKAMADGKDQLEEDAERNMINSERNKKGNVNYFIDEKDYNTKFIINCCDSTAQQ